MQFPNPNDYSAFMGDFSATVGVTTLCMMFFGRYVLGRFGWGPAAIITPMVTFITGMVFFSLILFPDVFAPVAGLMGFTPLYFAVIMGAAQNIFSKSAKYSLFDPCKEMAYIPLDTETKTKGKAAIDVVAARLGKSGGSFVQQILIVGMGSLAASTPYLVVLVMLVVGMWLYSTMSLSSQFEALNASELANELAEVQRKPSCTS